jgi:transcription initiation factor TFIID subunit 5
MSGPPNGAGPARAMSVGNGPPSAGLAPHNAMPPQQGPPSSSAAGPQSQQNLNQIVSERFFSCFSVLLHRQLHRRRSETQRLGQRAHGFRGDNGASV